MMENGRTDQKRQFSVILIIVFLGFFGISIPYLIFPPLFLNPEYTFLPATWGDSSRAFFLGITLAAYPLGQFVGSPILGALSDDYGRKPLLTASLILTALCNLVSGIAITKQNLTILIISRFIGGLMEGNVGIARAMCADLKLLSKHETFGKMNAAASIAFLIGPFVGGLMSDKSLYEGLSTSTPFFVTAIVFALLTGVSAILLKHSKAKTSLQPQTLWQRFNFIKRMATLFSNKHLKILMVVSTFFTLAVDMFYEFGPAYLTVKWELGPTGLVPYNGLLCLGLAIGNGWLSVFTASRIRAPLAIFSGIGGFFILLIATVFTHSPYFMLAWFAILGLLIGVVVNLLTVKISDSVSDRIQGEVMGTQQSLRVLGDGLICLFGGALLILSAKFILAAAALISLSTMIYYRKACREKQLC